jgi:TRAP-type C4-dicarboxylate transport system substrate-binding protein
MNRRTLFKSLAACAALIAATSAVAEDTPLRVSYEASAGSAVDLAVNAAAANLKGVAKVMAFPSSSIYVAADEFNAVKLGTIDMAIVPFEYMERQSAEFAGAMLGASPKGAEGTIDGVQVVAVWKGANRAILGQKAFQEPGDLASARLGVVGKANLTSFRGANGVVFETSSNDVRADFRANRINAFVSTLAGIRNLSLIEFGRTATVVESDASTQKYAVIFNPQRFSASDAEKIVAAFKGTNFKQFADQEEKDSREYMKRNGVNLVTLTPAQVSNLSKSLASGKK